MLELMRSAKFIARRERLDYRDLMQESIMRELGGRKSLTGPMQDLAKRERKHTLRPGKLETLVPNMGAMARSDHGGQESAMTASIDVQGLLSHLSFKQRQAVVLYCILGMNEAEMAEALSVTVDTINQRRFWGLRKLKKLVKQ